MGEKATWTVEIAFDENDDRTRADAKLQTTRGTHEFSGWGRAKRNPQDPDVPAIGELLAASRALADLSHHLMYEAANEIEQLCD